MERGISGRLFPTGQNGQRPAVTDQTVPSIQVCREEETKMDISIWLPTFQRFFLFIYLFIYLFLVSSSTPPLMPTSK